MVSQNRPATHPEVSRLGARRHDDLVHAVGGTFDYGLITTICEALCRLIDGVDLPDDRFLQRRVVAHVAALKAVHQFDLKGDAGSHGERLLATLNIAKARQPH